MSWSGEWEGSWPTWPERRKAGTAVSNTAYRMHLPPYRHTALPPIIRLPQVLTRHFARHLYLQQVQDRGPDVAQRAAVAQGAARVVAFPHQHERHRIGRMRRVGAAGHGIDHQLAVAVIGGDQQGGAAPLGALQHAREAAVDGFDRLHGRG